MPTLAEHSPEHAQIIALARRHGLELRGDLHANELGLDFRVVIAQDAAATRWVLRLPRRPDVLPKIEREARTLRLLKSRLPVAVPDWRIVTSELIAYPLLTDKPALEVEAGTLALTWNIDQTSPAFGQSLAPVLAALHGVPAEAAVAAGFSPATAAAARQVLAQQLDQVKREIGMGGDLERTWRTWLDDESSWPDFTTLIHGDLYVGHVLVNQRQQATGIIDWTEAELGDPAVDFSAHLMVFGAAGLDRLIADYAAAGGRIWPRMAHHVSQRLGAAPLKYALYALATGEAQHLAAAKTQLGLA